MVKLLRTESAASDTERTRGQSAAAATTTTTTTGRDEFNDVVHISCWCSVVVVHTTDSQDAWIHGTSSVARSSLLFSVNWHHPTGSVGFDLRKSGKERPRATKLDIFNEIRYFQFLPFPYPQCFPQFSHRISILIVFSTYLLTYLLPCHSRSSRTEKLTAVAWRL